jgi:hypothetical protein
MSREDDKDLKDNKDRGILPEETKSGRRRFVKGAVAAPVIFTVVSRPAMGGNFCTPSGFLSGNLSNQQDISCNGRSPGYWKRRFPAQYETTTFSQVFGGVWRHQTGVPWDPSITLKEVLDLADADDQYKFGFHAVGCYFNAVYRDQLGYPMTTDDVLKLVGEILMFGIYQDPATGLSMDTLETIDFMKSTYH